MCSSVFIVFVWIVWVKRGWWLRRVRWRIKQDYHHAVTGCELRRWQTGSCHARWYLYTLARTCHTPRTCRHHRRWVIEIEMNSFETNSSWGVFKDSVFPYDRVYNSDLFQFHSKWIFILETPSSWLIKTPTQLLVRFQSHTDPVTWRRERYFMKTCYV